MAVLASVCGGNRLMKMATPNLSNSKIDFEDTRFFKPVMARVKHPQTNGARKVVRYLRRFRQYFDSLDSLIEWYL